MTLRALLGGITFCAWLFHWVHLVANSRIELAAIWLMIAAVIWAALVAICRGHSRSHTILMAGLGLGAWAVFFAWLTLFIFAAAPDATESFADPPLNPAISVFLALMSAPNGIPAGVVLYRQLQSLLTPVKER